MLTIPKHLTLMILLWIPGLMLMGREGVTLYSIGNNTPWNSTGSWSRTPGGSPAGIIPQSNDTVIINSIIILNQNFLLNQNGRLEIKSSGFLKGSSFNLTLSGSSAFGNDGSAQLSELHLLDNASLYIGHQGKTEVVTRLSQLSQGETVVDGNLGIEGLLICGNEQITNASIIGSGFLFIREIQGTGLVMGMDPGSIPSNSTLSSINWIGSSDSEWNNPDNWSGQSVPSSNDNVSILLTFNQPVLSETGTCKNLHLSPGSSLSLNPRAILRIESNLVIPVDAQVSLSNSQNQHASLIISGSVEGKIRSSIQVYQNRPALIASPVIDAESEVFINMYLRSYDESASAWGNYIVPTNTPLASMRGYELQSPYADTRYFEGTPATGEMNVPISSANEGWNLVGNPYPYYLDWRNTESNGQGWDRSGVAEAIYYLDPNGTGNYSVYLPGNEGIGVNSGNCFISPMQGFFVKARKQSQNSILKVNNKAAAAVTEHSASSLPTTALRFHIDSQGYSDETVIRINPESSFDYDDDFDAYKLAGIEQAPSLFTTVSDDSRLAVNTLPSLTSSLEIPIGITSNQQANITFRIQGGAAFEYRYPLTLEDTQTKTVYDLRKDSVFTFSSAPGDHPTRFVLRFEEATGIEETNSTRPVVTFDQDAFQIKGLTGNYNHIEIFSLDGKQPLVNTISNSNVCRIPFNGSHGIYVVKITTKTASHVYKLFAE